jgi:uncharacterized protein YkwD
MPTPRVVRRRRAIKAGMGLLVLSLMSIAILRVYVLSTEAPSPEQATGLTDQESTILNRVNAERIRSGLRALKISARAAVVARGHSLDMAMRHYLAHLSPDGIGPAERLKGEDISFAAVGENIYADDYRDREHLAQRAVEGWLNSREHRATMLSDRFTETGVGIAQSDDGKTYVTEDFIR